VAMCPFFRFVRLDNMALKYKILMLFRILSGRKQGGMAVYNSNIDC
jgi:hypothetical protein